MLKNSVHLEVKKGDRLYRLEVPMDSPIGEVHDVLYQMRSYIVERINDSQKADKPKESEHSTIE